MGCLCNLGGGNGLGPEVWEVDALIITIITVIMITIIIVFDNHTHVNSMSFYDRRMCLQ